MNSSSLVSGLPPTSLPASRDTRSSPRRPRFERMCSTRNAESSPNAVAVSSGGRSGDSMAASDQRRKSARSVASIPSNSAITFRGNGALSDETKSISSVAAHVVEQGYGARAHELRQTGQGTWREPAVDETPERSVLGRVHVQDRSRRDRRCDVADGVVDQRASGRAEAGRISTDVSNVLVAGQHPEPLFAEVDGIVRPQARQHLVEVGSGEERRVTGVDALVPAHGLSVLCSPVPNSPDVPSRTQERARAHVTPTADRRTNEPPNDSSEPP